MKTVKHFLILAFAAFFVHFSNLTEAHAQVLIENGQTVTENFDALGTDAVATLPSGWKVDKDANNVRTVGTYAGAATATERRAGDNMASNAANGIYNFGAGDMTSATDRAVGWISSSAATKSGNLYLALENSGSSNINYFNISYDVEKYRQGTRAEGFSIQMYYSFDGTNWTDAGPDFLTSFAGSDTANAGYPSAPGEVVQIVDEELSVILSPGATLYLAWNYSVTSGTFTSNAQALGIDNVQIEAAAASTANDATLSSIATSLGTLVPTFNAGVYNYTVGLPFGTTTTPTVTATPSAPGATVNIIDAVDITSAVQADRTTIIEVESEDQTETKTYTVEFNVPTSLSNDATLASLTTDVGTLDPAFDPSVFYYNVELPYGVITTPIVTAISNYPFASVAITPAVNVNSTDSLERTTIITVVAEDTVTTETYLVQFNPITLIYTDVSNIHELRSGATDGTLYRLTGEAFLTYQQSYRNQKFIQDATAGILIDDFSNNITTSYNIGDGITHLIGSLGVYNSMLQFIPEVDPGLPSTVGNIILGEVKTISQIDSDDQGKLLKIVNASFPSTVDTFEVYSNYDLTDATGTIRFRTEFTQADYIGTQVPTYNVDITGILHQHHSTLNFTSRFLDDIEQSTSVVMRDNSFMIEAYPNPSAGDINFTIDLSYAQNVILSIYDLNGKKLFNYNNYLETGTHNIVWGNTNQVTAGIYFYTFAVDNSIKQGKVVITR